MSRSPQGPHIEELMADDALFGLNQAERRELAALPHEEDPTFELAAAAADLATLRRHPAPAHLVERLIAGVPGAAATRSLPDRPPSTRKARFAIESGWWAAAACGLLAAGGWWSFATKTVSPVVVERLVPGPAASAPAPPKPKDLASQRADLLAHAPDVMTLPWSPTKDAAALGVSGDVVWSESEQRGFMRFRGLRTNDPTNIQYQLWIFDKTQEHPIDGGVFDVSADGEVTVLIVAKLHVREPALFAVTIEKPGGVVVSKKEHIVVTAAYRAG